MPYDFGTSGKFPPGFTGRKGTFEGPYDDEDAEEKARKKIDYEDRKSSQEGDDRRKGAYD